MYRFKGGVDYLKINPILRQLIPAVYSIWHDKFPDLDMVITSGYRDDGSSHSGTLSKAIDLRRYHFGTQKWKDVEFCRIVQQTYGDILGVQLEPEWGMGSGYTAPHIHLQLKGDLWDE